MSRKIPADAFAFYVSLGSGRSYQAVAHNFDVSKQAITKLAIRERWQKRIDEIETTARARSETKAIETLEAMNERHMRTLQVIQRKALETLKAMPLTSAMDAVRALDMSIAKERLVRGEPSDRTAVSIEDVIRQEYESWMTDGNNGKEDRRDGSES